MIGFFFLKLIILYFVLFIVLFIHEFGHYIAARFFLIRPQKVVIGKGASIFQINNFIFKIFPVGGFTDIKSKDLLFLSKLDKSFIILNGSFFNIFLGVFFMILSIFFNPNITRIPLYKQQKLNEINGIKVNNFYDIRLIRKNFNSTKNKIKITIINDKTNNREIKELPIKKFDLALTYKELYMPVNPSHSFILKIKSIFIKKYKHKLKKITIESILWTIGILSFFTGFFNLVPFCLFGQVSDGCLFLKTFFSNRKKKNYNCKKIKKRL